MTSIEIISSKGFVYTQNVLLLFNNWSLNYTFYVFQNNIFWY